MKKADVQIVQAGEDREIAVKIADGIRRRGIDVWVDLESVMSGFTPVRSVEQAVRNCRVVIYIVSLATEHPNWELEAAVMENAATEQIVRDVERVGPKVVPVRVDDTTLSPAFAHRGFYDIREDDFEKRLDILVDALRKQLDRRKIFISHSSKDKAEVQPIVDCLKDDDSLDVSYDNDALQPGSIIRRGIESGISSADYLIAVISQNVIDTLDGWIGFELDQAYEIERERNKYDHYFAIPVLLEAGLKTPGWLGTKVYVDLTKGFDAGMERLTNALHKPTTLV
jgi:hypothetical protein